MKIVYSETQEKFQKLVKRLEARMGSGPEAQAGCWQAVWSWRFARIFAAATHLLSDIYDAFIFLANSTFKCNPLVKVSGNGKIVALGMQS